MMEAISLKREADFREALVRVRANVIDTPLLNWPNDAGRDIRLKAENLQPGGSFKIRCATNIVEQLPVEAIRRGIVTASAGNFAPSVAVAAARHRVPVTCHTLERAAEVKLQILRRLGVKVVPHSFADWWRIMETRDTGADEGLFLHPVTEIEGIVGNGTIALELLEEWPDIDAIVVPFGGGGLVSGIAAAIRALKADVKVFACELEEAAPLAAAFAAGGPVPFERSATFANGSGVQTVLAPMWPLLNGLLDGVITVPETEALSAFRSLALDGHLVVEAQSSIALAAALSPKCAGRNVAAILSGGNIDRGDLVRNLG